jgi:hypothetical protein
MVNERSYDKGHLDGSCINMERHSGYFLVSGISALAL